MEHLSVDYRQGMPIAEFAAQIRDALGRSKLVVTTGVEPSANSTIFWDQVSEQIGSPCHQFQEDMTGARTGEKWQEIRYNPDVQNSYRYGKNAQPLHTDGSYMKNGPGVVFFFCIKAAPSGGATTFIDSEELVSSLRKGDPELLRDLERTSVHFSKASEHKTRPIISTDSEGLLLTWNYYCVDATEPAFNKALAERFHQFLQQKIVAARRLTPVALRAGEAVFFKDERLLHGRDAFLAERHDDRFLLKSAFDLNPT